MILFIIFIQILSSESQLFNFPSPELSFHKQELPIKPGQLQQEPKNTSQVSSPYENKTYDKDMIYSYLLALFWSQVYFVYQL